MSNWTRSVLTIVALFFLPVATLSPLILFAATPCHQFAKKDVCSWSGCDLGVGGCNHSDGNAAACNLVEEQAEIQIGMFTCVTIVDINSTCDPVQNAKGGAAVTKCVRVWGCKYDDKRKTCFQSIELIPCMAPYYTSNKCTS